MVTFVSVLFRTDYIGHSQRFVVMLFVVMFLIDCILIKQSSNYSVQHLPVYNSNSIQL